MAGHNKWSKVKHIKARVDAIKGRVFSKCAHEIALATLAGGGAPAANTRLRAAFDNALKKGPGESGGETIQEISYEGYRPAGIAFIIEMATDNLNRAAADIRLIFSKNGGSVATPGSISNPFDRKVLKLHDPLNDSPDTLNVFTKFEVSDEILDPLAS